ncbi:MAG: metal ABC transporter substrate-binding protein [Anaerolineales bacterium]|nr:metal ABC transporter substrate-binding protein [Anaerolineales bacterium]
MKLFGILWMGLFVSACGIQSAPLSPGSLNVVATTGIVADVVQQVGGDLIDVQVLLPVGADPHSFQPTPQDIAKVANADLVFANGAGLENFLVKLLENADAQGKMIAVSDGIALRENPDLDEAGNHGDPHTWTDPNNVMIWVENIEAALSVADPVNAETYAANAAAYTAEVQAIDT